MPETTKPTVNYHYEPIPGLWRFEVWDEGELIKEFTVTGTEIETAPRNATASDILRPHFEGLPQFDQLLDELNHLPFGVGRS